MLCFFIVVIGFFVIYVLNCPPSSYGYRREDISEPEYEYEYGDDDYDEEDDEDYEYDDDIIDDGDYPDYDVYQEGSQRETDYWYYYNTDEEE